MRILHIYVLVKLDVQDLSFSETMWRPRCAQDTTITTFVSLKTIGAYFLLSNYYKFHADLFNNILTSPYAGGVQVGSPEPPFKINDIHSMHVVECLYIHIFLHLYTSTMRLKLI